MVKKMNLSSLFKSTDKKKSTWPWPSCRQPRTLSFRTTASAAAAVTETSDSYFTISSECGGSFSTASESSGGDQIERMIQGLRSERLLFKPTGKTSSIMAEEEAEGDDDVSLLLKESTTILSMDSEDPYLDFRKSMEEMVEAHGMREWRKLEELLSWYLRVNGKGNHGYILGAFVDLLVCLALASSSSSSQHSPFSLCSSSSCSSSFCSSSSSFIPSLPSMQIEEITSFEEDDVLS